jgi:AcrR family transcriptional regulator
MRVAEATELKSNEADPRVRRTRKLLQDALMELMGEKGFQLTTVQDIAERATVNRATFYAHYEDKYALLDQMVGDLFRQRLTRLVTPASPFTQANLQRFVVTVLEGLAEFNGHCKHTDRDVHRLIEGRVQGEIEAFLQAWLAAQPSHEAEPRPRPATLAQVLSWAIYGAGSAWSRSPNETPAEEAAREIVATLTVGIARALQPGKGPKASDASASLH